MLNLQKKIILVFLLIAIAVSLNFEHQLTHQQTSKLLYLPIYVGKGYNIFKGNPLHNQKLDPGFKSTVFEFSYKKKNKTSDGLFIVPDSNEVETTQKTSCSSSSQISQYRGTTSYQKQLATKATVGGAYNGSLFSASFSTSVGFKQMNNQTNILKNIVTHAIGECQRYELAIKDFTFRNFSNDFIQGIKHSVKFNNWGRFIDSYGTHYVNNVIMGGRVVQQSTYNYQSVQKLSAMQVDINLLAKASYAKFSGEVSSDINKSLKDQQYLQQQERTQKMLFIGGIAQKDFINWTKSVTNNSMPITYQLKSITQLFSKIPQFQSSAISIQQSYEKYLKIYCQQIGCSNPKPDCEKPKPPSISVFKSGTYGGNGGSYFIWSNDSFFNDIKGVNIRSGKFIDSIQLIVGHKIQRFSSLIYGGGGGVYQEWRIPQGVKVGSIEIRYGNYVDSLLFHTTQGSSPQFGRNGGRLSIIPIYLNQRIVGIQGRSARYLDQLGFIISTKIFPQYCPR